MASDRQRHMRRRTLLQAGCLSGLGLGLPEFLAARDKRQVVPSSGKAKSCILLFATGGPAQQETFDPKPDADSRARPGGPAARGGPARHLYWNAI